MKEKLKWKILLVIGICPFVLPIVVGIYRMSIESWIMVDWLVMYSFVYWPTYVIGAGMIGVAAWKLLKK